MTKNSYAAQAAAGAVAPSAFGETLVRAVARLRARWDAYRRARAIDRRARETVEALMALDSRQLRDIGLCRSEILSAVYGPERDRRVELDLEV